MVTYDIKTKGNHINLSYPKSYLFIYFFTYLGVTMKVTAACSPCLICIRSCRILNLRYNEWLWLKRRFVTNIRISVTLRLPDFHVDDSLTDND